MISYNEELQLHCINKIPAFEGWYFRIVDEKVSIGIIVGIAKTKTKQEAFIQVFHTLSQTMEKVTYPIESFQYQADPFTIEIGKCIFKRHYIHIEDKKLETVIDIEFDMPLHIKQTLYAPTIMGPFAYIRNMQCHHAIINLEGWVFGRMKYLNNCYDIRGIIYQEKDWGYSFPKKYIWVQSNCCIEKKAIVFLSCATIPLKLCQFTGVIMVLFIDNEEYYFASYYGARVTKAEVIDNIYFLCIKQDKFTLEMKIKIGPTFFLDAPKEGLMIRNVKEGLRGEVELKLYKYKQCKEVLSFHHCGIENDRFFN